MSNSFTTRIGVVGLGVAYVWLGGYEGTFLVADDAGAAALGGIVAVAVVQLVVITFQRIPRAGGELLRDN